jgi:hypothetical protein
MERHTVQRVVHGPNGEPQHQQATHHQRQPHVYAPTLGGEPARRKHEDQQRQENEDRHEGNLVDQHWPAGFDSQLKENRGEGADCRRQPDSELDETDKVLGPLHEDDRPNHRESCPDQPEGVHRQRREWGSNRRPCHEGSEREAGQQKCQHRPETTHVPSALTHTPTAAGCIVTTTSIHR